MGCGLVNGWTAVDPALAMTAAVADRPATIVQSAWMFVIDLFAAAVPVIPFALFSPATARMSRSR